MILVDSNIPMYLVGEQHPHKSNSRKLLEGCIAKGERMVTDVEVLQEILHRYAAINRREAIQPAFDALLGVVDQVLPVELKDAERAKAILLERAGLSPRDALHLAVMEHHGISRILSFDAGFDDYPAVSRIYS